MHFGWVPTTDALNMKTAPTHDSMYSYTVYTIASKTYFVLARVYALENATMTLHCFRKLSGFCRTSQYIIPAIVESAENIEKWSGPNWTNRTRYYAFDVILLIKGPPPEIPKMWFLFGSDNYPLGGLGRCKFPSAALITDFTIISYTK